MKQILSILIFLIVFSCTPEEREKPSNVPKDAIWKGGADGGCWILFKTVKDNSVEAIIYFEHGEVWDKGVFKKVGNCNIEKTNIIEEIGGFNGESLFTNTTCYFEK